MKQMKSYTHKLFSCGRRAGAGIGDNDIAILRMKGSLEGPTTNYALWMQFTCWGNLSLKKLHKMWHTGAQETVEKRKRFSSPLLSNKFSLVKQNIFETNIVYKPLNTTALD
jgi:hypothetical protein